jgi:hypothetical protein
LSLGRARAGVLLAIPFLLIVVVPRPFVPKWGDRIARRIASVVTSLHLGRPVAPPKPPSLPEIGTPVPEDVGADNVADAAPPKPNARPTEKASPPPAAVRIPPAKIQWAIDDRGAHIHTKTVRGADGKPAGIRISGVSGLGTGLRDGDVIVAVEGAPAMDEEAATDLALSAIARGSSTLHATAMRGDRSFPITAELPLPSAPPPPSAPSPSSTSGTSGKAR